MANRFYEKQRSCFYICIHKKVTFYLRANRMAISRNVYRSIFILNKYIYIYIFFFSQIILCRQQKMENYKLWVP